MKVILGGSAERRITITAGVPPLYRIDGTQVFSHAGVALPVNFSRGAEVGMQPSLQLRPAVIDRGTYIDRGPAGQPEFVVFSQRHGQLIRQDAIKSIK